MTRIVLEEPLRRYMETQGFKHIALKAFTRGG